MVSACVVAAFTLVPLTLMGCGDKKGNGGAFKTCTKNDTKDGCTAPLEMQTCTKDGCTKSTKRVALDATSMEMQHLVSTKDDALMLGYESGKGGPRVYLIEEDGTNKNFMFELQGQELTFDVELSTMLCGFNAALYFVGMTRNDGGAEAGTKYCDAQAEGGTYCSEMDLFEGNTEAQQYTTHGCNGACTSFTENVEECKKGAKGEDEICDHNGCGQNPFRYGPKTTSDEETSNWHWYGSGAGFSLDASKSFTVVTQFESKTRISRFYLQDGKRIDLPSLYVKPPSDGSDIKQPFSKPVISPEYCKLTGDSWDGGADLTPLGQMWENMANGMVLAMSTWYDQETYVDGKVAEGDATGMSWMDGTNGWGKAGPCNKTTTDAGDHWVTFSNIRYGPVGTTTKFEEELALV